MMVKVANKWESIEIQLLCSGFDSIVPASSLFTLENLLGFRVEEATVVDRWVLVVRRDVPAEWDGLAEDVFCYECKL